MKIEAAGREESSLQPSEPSPSLEKDRIFALFACCLPVKGARRSTVCDVQRNRYLFIPNGLFEILTEHRGRTVDEIQAAYDHEFDDEIEGYFRFLLREELGFWCDEPSHFPDIDLHWDPPRRITNAIIDIDEASDHDYRVILDQLDDLGCEALQARFFMPFPMREVETLLELSKNGRLRSIDLAAGYRSDLKIEKLETLCLKYQRLSGILVHSVPPAEANVHEVPFLNVRISFSPELVDSAACCGQVHPAYFSVNLPLFTESQRFNSCLNRKISVDRKGEIRNCPSTPRSFGNIKRESLHSALAHRDFAELWTIHKDQIEICKDCEFRHICTDCRAYLSRPEDNRSKPEKCSYDPYTATWR